MEKDTIFEAFRKALVDILIPEIRELRKDIQENSKKFETQIIELRKEMNERFEEMRREMNERFEEMRREMNERFAKIDERFAKIDERFAKNDERFARIEARMANMEGKLDILIDRDKIYAEVVRLVGNINILTRDIKIIKKILIKKEKQKDKEIK